MDGDIYQKNAMRTNDGKSTERLGKALWNTSVVTLEQTGFAFNPREDADAIDFGGFIMACLGLSGEIGEFNDIAKKIIFHEAEFDEEHLKKELGDILWYAAMMCESFGWYLDDIMQMNIDKLRKRYPDGFDVERANHREDGDI